MAKKRVSVRLSATGGRQVKDALRSVGEAGQQGFRRLSREMEAAKRRLERFARQATRTARVVGAAAAGLKKAALRIDRPAASVPRRGECKLFRPQGNIVHKPFFILVTCAALAGCSSVGTVNGVPVNQEANLSTQSEPSYCARQPAVCILGGVVAVGAAAYLIDEANDDGGGGGAGDAGTDSGSGL